MRNFQTQYRNPERHFTEKGSRVRKTYGPVYDDAGRLHLEEKGEENLYDYIQSFADSVDIHVILKRFANGEPDVLSKVQGFYGDFTGFPSSYSQILNAVNDGRRLFDSLPVETRAQFGHNFDVFMTAVADGSLLQKLGVGDPAPAPSPAESDPSP